jgi:hypothetical protein
MAALRMRRLGWSRIMKMSDREDYDSELNPDFWREYLENAEATRQLADAAYVENFWKQRS